LVISFQEQLRENTIKDGHNNDGYLTDYLKKTSPKSKKLLGLNTISAVEILKKYDSDTRKSTIDHNANVGLKKSIQNRIAEATKPSLKFVGLEELYREGSVLFGDAFSLDPLFNGRLYLHNSTKLERPYCIGVSAMDIMQYGRPYAEIEGVPPSHVDAFMGQMVEYIMNLSGEFAGAVAVSDWIPVLAWYVEKEGIPLESKDHRMISVKQLWQSKVHILHNPYRHDGDPPFTNISLNSPSVLRQVFEHYKFPDGKTVESIMPVIMDVQKVIAEFMYKGDPKKGGLQYKFPVITCNFRRDEVGENGTEWWKYITRLNHKGCFNISVADQFSSCCRLLSDTKMAQKYKVYSNGGGGIKIGAHQVCALNLAGIAYDAMEEDTVNHIWREYSPMLDYHIDMAAMYLYTHKMKMLLPRVKNNMYTFFSPFKNALDEDTGIGPWLHLNMLYSVIGEHALPDAVGILLGDKRAILTEEGGRLGERILSHVVMRANELTETMPDYQGVKCIFSVEQTPAEASSATMAAFDGIEKIYSNQFVPLEMECDIWKRVEIEGRMSSVLTGGSMTFLTLDRMLSPEQSMKFHDRVMEVSNKKINQFCINYGWSVDSDHALVGNFNVCPECGKSMKHFERVVGYMVDKDKINQPRVENDIEKRARNII